MRRSIWSSSLGRRGRPCGKRALSSRARPSRLSTFLAARSAVGREVKVALGQQHFEGRYCLSLWLMDARTLVPSGESAGDLSNEVVILAWASRRSPGEVGVQFPRSSEPRNGLRSHSRSTRSARNTESPLRIASPLIEVGPHSSNGSDISSCASCACFQLSFGAPDLLLCDP